MNQSLHDAWIVAATRTPVGKAPKGILHATRPDDLLAHVLRAVTSQAPSIDLKQIDDAIIGCAMPEAEQGINVARVGVLLAGLPESIAAQTVNRFCASGLQAVALAANEIRLGQADLILAGGVESMSMVPMMGNKIAINPRIFTDEHKAIAYGMGLTAENVAQQWAISREDQDMFALASHQKALAAIREGQFKDEISPFTITKYLPQLDNGTIQAQTQCVAMDEGPRPDTSLEKLAKLRPVFRNGLTGGSVTAGNSSQISDGAAALLLASEKAINDYELTPLARLVSFAVAGVRPEIMGIGPLAAIPKALKRAGLRIEDMDWIELNEAFAAQALAVIRDGALDTSKINPLGGAIALGHPLGATGAIRTTTLAHGLRRHKKRYGMVTMCIGTGMGAAAIFESA